MDTSCHFPEVIQLLSRPKNNNWVFRICRLESNFLFPIPRFLFPIPRSLFPIPSSLFPIPSSLFPIPQSKRLHREVAVHTGDDDVAGSGAERTVNHKKVAILYSRARHGIALYADEERGGWPLHEKFVQVKRLLLVLLRRGWEPRHDGA